MPGPQVKDWETYHALRRKGHSKEAAARIANSRAGRRRKKEDVEKGQPAMSDVHVSTIPRKKKKKKKKGEDDDPRKILHDRFKKHYAPTHDTGTGQEVHAPGGGGGGGDDDGGGDKGEQADRQSSLEPERTTPPSESELTERDPGDENLRPDSFDGFVGQKRMTDQLKIMMESAKQRNQPLDHILFEGPPGLGKTTLANIVANEMGGNLQVITGPAIRNPQDLALKLMSLEDGDTLFIDEIHALDRNLQEILYPAMEDFEMDVRIGGNPPFRVELPEFTLIGATTRAGDLDRPLVDRFGMVGEMEFYDPTELSQLVNMSASKLGVEMAEDAATNLAKRARGTPRIANHLLQWTRDYALVKHGTASITPNIVDEALQAARIDHAGLGPQQRDYLSVLTEGAAGLNTLSARTGDAEVTIANDIEPYLVREGYVTRTGRGRMITDKGRRHLEELEELGFAKSAWAAAYAFTKHMGPGDHPSGSPQSSHGKGGDKGRGGESPKRLRQTPGANAPFRPDGPKETLERIERIAEASDPLMSDPGKRRGGDTMGLYGEWDEDDNFLWFTQERHEWQRQVILEHEARQIAKNGRPPKAEKKALIMTGLPGSGKTFTLDKFSPVEMEDYVVVNADDLKESIIFDDAPPDIGDEFRGMELSSVVHEESSFMAKQWQAKLQEEGTNMVLDITGGRKESTMKRINQLIDAGYTVDIAHVDVNPQAAWRSALKRYAEGIGTKKGGRPVPPKFIEAMAVDAENDTIDLHFEEYRSATNGRWWHYRNYPVEKKEPELVASSES